jgi:thioredoxin 1
MQETENKNPVVELDSDHWSKTVLESRQPILVDFWHDECVWCKRLEPELRQLAPEFEGRLRFAKLNIFANPGNEQLGVKYGILGTPTLLLFCNGRPVDSIVGYRAKEVLKLELGQKLENAKDCVRQSTPVGR